MNFSTAFTYRAPWSATCNAYIAVKLSDLPAGIDVEITVSGPGAALVNLTTFFGGFKLDLLGGDVKTYSVKVGRALKSARCPPFRIVADALRGDQLASCSKQGSMFRETYDARRPVTTKETTDEASFVLRHPGGDRSI